MGVKEYPIHHDTILEGLKSIDLKEINTRSGASNQLKKYIDNESIRQFLLKNLYWVEKGKLGWRINIDVLDNKITEIVKSLLGQESFVEVLFIGGGQSNYILKEDYDDIRNVFPLADFHTIEKAGHWIHAETPEEFMQQVLGYCLR
jgi:esterase